MTSAPVTPVADPLDDMVANPHQPAPETRTFFGQVVTLDQSNWKLVKGQGRVPFDQTYDEPRDKVRAIAIVIECEKRDGNKYMIDTGRQPLLEIDKAWHGVTLPSLQKLGVPLSQLRTKFVQVERVETGEKYTDKNGESKPRTALKFVAAYDDWHAMHAARELLFGRNRPTSGPPETAAAPAAVSAPTIDRAALKKVLPGLWQASGQNKTTFATMFNANPAFTQAFSLEEATLFVVNGTPIDDDDLPF